MTHRRHGLPSQHNDRPVPTSAAPHLLAGRPAGASGNGAGPSSSSRLSADDFWQRLGL